MRVFITGATGFIGRAVVLRLRRDGHAVMAYVRSPDRARSLLGGEVALLPIASGDQGLRDALAECDAVVNLAGEPTVGQRWTSEYRRVLVASRVGVTERIVRAIVEARVRPKVLISGSAVGVYGDRGDEVLTEASAPGDDFLAQLCRDWEAAAERASLLGTRVVCLRTGVVFGREGGALAKMVPIFRAGVGGRLGSGKQFVPWIHLHDLASVIARALLDARYEGPINATAPEPVTNVDLTRAIARAVRRPAFFPVPSFALRAALGGVADALLASQRAIPAKLQALGHPFEFPTLDSALDDILRRQDVRIEPLADDSPSPEGRPDYLNRRRPRYLLRARVTLNVPIEDVFAFFAQPMNLGVITPSNMELRVQGVPGAMQEGARIHYRLRVGPFPIQWRTRIERWEPGRCFVDAQEAGPYRAWWHEHHFHAEARKTVMEDRVYYSPPAGWIGRVANGMFVTSALERIFGYRLEAIRLRFGLA